MCMQLVFFVRGKFGNIHESMRADEIETPPIWVFVMNHSFLGRKYWHACGVLELLCRRLWWGLRSSVFPFAQFQFADNWHRWVHKERRWASNCRHHNWWAGSPGSCDQRYTRNVCGATAGSLRPAAVEDIQAAILHQQKVRYCQPKCSFWLKIWEFLGSRPALTSTPIHIPHII